MIKYQIETRLDKYSEWKPRSEWLSWDEIYPIWLVEEETKSKEQWCGYENIRMVREGYGVLDNCLLYNAWVKRVREENRKQNIIKGNVNSLIEMIVDSENDYSPVIYLRKLKEILENLEPLDTEESYGSHRKLTKS